MSVSNKLSFLITTMKWELPCANLSVTDIIKKIGDQTLIYSHNKKMAYQYADPLHSKVSSADRCFIHKKV